MVFKRFDIGKLSPIKVAQQEEEVKDSFANKNKPIIIEENQVKPQANFLSK